MLPAERTQPDPQAGMETRPWTRTIGMAGIIVPIWFTALVALQGFLSPDYSHMRLPISALAAWPTGWIQNLNFLVAGSLLVAFAFALDRATRPTQRGIAGIGLLAAGGAGVALAGVFPWIMVDGVPTETLPHVVAAILSFTATGLGFVVFSRRMTGDPRWRGLATYTLTTGVSVLVLFFAVGFFAIDDDAPLHPWAGLIQRVLCAIWFTCLIVLARRLLSLGPRPA